MFQLKFVALIKILILFHRVTGERIAYHCASFLSLFLFCRTEAGVTFLERFVANQSILGFPSILEDWGSSFGPSGRRGKVR